ncbi:TPR Domain containing protein [Histomonas meleagridis]|uniref:TPR Domain containing protein n=1 Tax=Histomonas meleagridis TaxID=135588 RepID=UPI00355A6072|nr:TPR Domain containing protein [Histomonas meleagridis]KAH0798552.1 TPR Domain containing protein [Histomonas meleagridis]
MNDQRSISLSLLAQLLDVQRENDQNITDNEFSNSLGILPISNSSKFDTFAPLIKTAQAISADFDSINKYIFSAILFKGGRYKECIPYLIESLSSFPLNRSAWKLLLQVLIRFDDATVTNTLVSLPDHWMKTFFQIELLSELQQTEAAIQMLPKISDIPRSASVIALEATVYYHNRDFDRSLSLFEELRTKFPFYLESLELYSNLLFVKEDVAGLSALSQSLTNIDKFRPETLTATANFFSINGKHEEAISLFAMALRFDSSFTFAWTLIGHEYVELDNITAAITAYTKAIEYNPRDFRALYGLGRAYEIAKMPYHSIIYYRKAVIINPFDSRMWLALGECYEELMENENAIRCYQRAVCNVDSEGLAIYKLAQLYKEEGDEDKTAFCFESYLDKFDNEGEMRNEEQKEAIMFLAQYYRNKDKSEKANLYAQKLLFDPNTVAEGNALMRDIRSDNK